MTSLLQVLGASGECIRLAIAGAFARMHKTEPRGIASNTKTSSVLDFIGLYEFFMNFYFASF